MMGRYQRRPNVRNRGYALVFFFQKQKKGNTQGINIVRILVEGGTWVHIYFSWGCIVFLLAYSFHAVLAS